MEKYFNMLIKFIKDNDILMIVILISILLVCYFNVGANKGKINKSIIKGNTNEIYSDKQFIPKTMFKTGPDHYNNLNNELSDIFNDMINDNPGLVIEYYDDKDSREFIKNNFNSDVLEAYDSLIPGAYKADLFRYCILYKRGGIYSDLSQRIVKPLNEIIDFENDNLVLVEDIPQPSNIGPEKGKYARGIQISFMASRPNNDIYMNAINRIVNNYKTRYRGENPLDPTGPRLFYRVLKDYQGEYKLNLKEARGKIIDKISGQLIIITRTKNHHSKNLKGKPHYSELWWRKQVYR